MNHSKIIVFIALSLTFALCGGSLFAFQPPIKPRPVTVSGVLQLDGDRSILGIEKPFIVVGPLTGAVETCEGRYIHLTGFIQKPCPPIDGRQYVLPPAPFLRVNRLWTKTPISGKPHPTLRGTLKKIDRGLFVIGTTKFACVGDLRDALEKCVGLHLELFYDHVLTCHWMPEGVRVVAVYSIAVVPRFVRAKDR